MFSSYYITIIHLNKASYLKVSKVYFTPQISVIPWQYFFLCKCFTPLNIFLVLYMQLLISMLGLTCSNPVFFNIIVVFINFMPVCKISKPATTKMLWRSTSTMLKTLNRMTPQNDTHKLQLQQGKKAHVILSSLMAIQNKFKATMQMVLTNQTDTSYQTSVYRRRHLWREV